MEEDIKIQDLIEHIRFGTQLKYDMKTYLIAIENLIARYKKIEKEFNKAISEQRKLIRENTKLKKEKFDLEKENIHWKGKYYLENRKYIELHNEKIDTPVIRFTEEVLKAYIPKLKVKEKIEELKQDVKDFEDYWSKDPRRFKRQQCIDYYKLEALQELLED